jgi:anti-sigma factor RsiW
MTPLSCDEFTTRLVDYADGQLPSNESHKVTEHLAGCETCRRQLEALRRSLEVARVVWEDNEVELASVGSEGIVSAERLSTRRVRHRRMTLIAAGVVLLIGGALLRQLTRQPASVVTQSPELLTPDEIRREVMRAGIAMQLVVAADLLAEQPGGEEYACERYRHIVTAYANSPAALVSQNRLKSLCDERVEQ